MRYIKWVLTELGGPTSFLAQLFFGKVHDDKTGAKDSLNDNLRHVIFDKSGQVSSEADRLDKLQNMVRGLLFHMLYNADPALNDDVLNRIENLVQKAHQMKDSSKRRRTSAGLCSHGRAIGLLTFEP